MIGLINRVKEQVYSLLFFVRRRISIMPMLILFFHAVTYSLFTYVTFEQFKEGIPMNDYQFPDWYLVSEFWIKHIFENSFITLLFISIFYRNLNKSGVFCLCILWGLWVCNTLRVLIGFESQIYFYVWITIIYGTFLYLCLKSIINRNK